jgi:hypothetical protein
MRRLVNWLHAEHLTLVYREEPLAQYRVTYQPDQRRLQTVTPEQLCETPHRSPQRPLWTWGEDEWQPVLRLPANGGRRPRPTGAIQPSLFALEEVSDLPPGGIAALMLLPRVTANMCQACLGEV